MVSSLQQVLWLVHGHVTLHHMDDMKAVEAAGERYREWRRETGTMPPDWWLDGGEPPSGGFRAPSGSAPSSKPDVSNAARSDTKDKIPRKVDTLVSESISTIDANAW